MKINIKGDLMKHVLQQIILSALAVFTFCTATIQASESELKRVNTKKQELIEALRKNNATQEADHVS